MTGPPIRRPVGLHVARTAKALNRAFEAALAEAGGSLPTWLILLELKRERRGTQRARAEAVGVRGPTMTHHLDGLERAGLITRTRDPDNRRVQRVELTAEGDLAFDRLREAAMAFDARLRRGIGDAELDALAELLDRLAANAQ